MCSHSQLDSSAAAASLQQKSSNIIMNEYRKIVEMVLKPKAQSDLHLMYTEIYKAINKRQIRKKSCCFIRVAQSKFERHSRKTQTHTISSSVAKP
jgi:hypothetical protein